MFTTRPEIIGTHGVASSTHWLAAQTAMGVLERGGNAFDAAVAAGFVLQVVEPHLNGVGGEVPILYWSERERRAVSLKGQGCAPGEATPQAFGRLGFEQVPGIGLLAATVPAAFSTWMTMLLEQGSCPLQEVLAPAIRYAREGFPVSTRLAEAILGVRPLFLEEWHTSADVWLDQGRVPRPGSLMCLPAWASTMARVVEEAQQAGPGRCAVIEAAMRIWQQGFVAQEIDAFCRTQKVRDTSGERHAGLLRLDDMASWRPDAEAPLTLAFGAFEVAKCGFWSQGPLMLQNLAMLRHGSLEQHAPTSAGFVHSIAEATKLGLADRLAWYGSAPGADPKVQHALLDDVYARQRWARVDPQAAARALEPGSPLGCSPRLPDLGVCERSLRTADTRYGLGEPTFLKLPPVAEWADRELFVGDTCQISVIDGKGNMVAATPSGGWLSSSPTIASLGFALGTRLQMAWLDEGLPNSLTPRVAPCTTLSPTLAMRDGEPCMVFGTPGGDQQDQWSTAFFLRHAVYGMNLQEAIDAPAFHVKHYPSSFWPRSLTLNRLSIEPRFPDATIAQLRELGHDVHINEPWSESRISACSRMRDARGRLVLRAAASPRGMQGYAVGR
ncbi:Putative gamma-glutamyltransferase YwrD [Variovorax sp. PBS-H4]|uniref:gamma-glutamyltransferase family protein n=1 Tax=Variovorax sp. PBS-H4 TaxID=434008 RepID=UPI001315BE19|nr:gamma-glutamyltransferase [Variovorax sp. PBS-H4]VTU21019.1 Putative gamma-glutamyltransferase YwrD [Variovorax sp. PBS-H4]